MNIGDSVNGYSITSIIGHGGMGTVFLATKDGVEYVIKTYRYKDKESLLRFQREFRIMEQFHGNFAIKVYEADFSCDEPYFVMEKCDCKLVDYCKGKPSKERLEKLIDVCSGISELHCQGIIHRDIKADNILVKNGHVKITDFGLGRFINRDSTTLTTSDMYMGTEGYIAPEITYKDGAKNADERCDIYSLSGLIFNVLTGKSPLFLNSSLLSADIYPIVSKCRKFDPDQRYQNAKEVGDAIKTAIKIRICFVDMVNLLANINNMSKNNFRENAISILANSTSLSEFISNYNTLGSVIFKDIIEHNLNYANYLAYIYYSLVELNF